VFGLDDWIAGFSDGATIPFVLLVAVLLGLRHATDPDHLAAVTTLVASGKDRGKRTAARLGIAWGLGHALALFAFGLPILLYQHYLPEPVQKGAETAAGIMIAGLAVWLLVRWRRGLFHVHVHEHDRGHHAHVHTHARADEHAHRSPARLRTPFQAFAIGLVHGVGGSAGVGILLLTAVQSTTIAVVSLGLLALFTSVSMAILTTGFGLTLSSRPVRRSFNAVAPALGMVSLAFGIWYALSALELAPYYL
jgi:ABC-type nickel/cobalt efflux system permease component RcnA